MAEDLYAGAEMPDETPDLTLEESGALGGFVPLAQLAKRTAIDYAAVRERLAGTRGRQYWKSLEELADTDEFRLYLEREFPRQAPREMAPVSRREFFRVMGATLALAGVGSLSGCGYQPPEKIVPYLQQPEDIVPGKPLYYATAFVRGGYGFGLLGETHVGRPVKLEGNPEHPASLGSTDLFAQAAILGLYDPDRSQAVRHLGDTTTWDQFATEVSDLMEEARKTGGEGIHLLLGAFTSPTLADQLQRFLKRYPKAKITQHEPAGRDQVRAGAQLAFGQDVQPVYDFSKAKRVLALDSDFLNDEPGSVRYARDYATARKPGADMNRLYVIEASPTLTGANADHRLTVRPSQIEEVARAVLAGVGGGEAAAPKELPKEFVPALVADLKEHRGASLVIAGPGQPATVHALAHAINGALGNIGSTVILTAPVEVGIGQPLKSLVEDIRGGKVRTLFVLGCNPIYTAPADLQFAEAYQNVRTRVHLGLYEDETGVQSHWHIPQSHFLEAWSDVRAFDGTASVVQPLIKPLYPSKSIHEIVELLIGEAQREPLEIIREHWQGQTPAAAYEPVWYKALLGGTLPNTKAPSVSVSLKPSATAAPPPAPAAGEGSFEILFRPDPTIWDGSYSNNGWLQEIPKPLTALTWDNAALIAAATAEAQGLHNGDVIEITYRERKLEAAVWVMPGQPMNTLTLTLGYGRTHAGKVGTGTGFNAYALRTADFPGFGTGAQIRKTGKTYQLVSAQHHFSMEGRDLAMEGMLDEYLHDPQDPEFLRHVQEGEGALKGHDSLYEQQWPSDRTPLSDGRIASKGVGDYASRGYGDNPIPAWGMVIDLNQCVGCNACTVACQAENNIATVGKDQVDRNREMHWMRIDTYYLGPLENPETVFQPMGCQHCEKAPCEPVCPVAATTHSAEGINEMTYNRCIGTRYCGNNCPYKVRRFNFLQDSDQFTPTIQMMRNPDVTVRSRGVMEKCTFCIQRINLARIEAEKEERPLRDGDVVTACQQVCPTQAITFGDTNDTRSNGKKGSRVRQLKLDGRNYTVLSELSTFPRVSYLAKIRNPNPALKHLLAKREGGEHEEHNSASPDGKSAGETGATGAEH